MQYTTLAHLRRKSRIMQPRRTQRQPLPHPSPDGKWLLFLSYPPGTKGHPANLQVKLRIMPHGGGPIRELDSLLGGQGTINVPSWSPKGQLFAYVTYRLLGAGDTASR